MKKCRTGEENDLEFPVLGVGFRGVGYRVEDGYRVEGVGQVYSS